jgi:xanthine dehydrogenase accessory factor
MSTELLARADRLRLQRTPFVLATVVRAERPTSAKAGDRAIVMADGTIEGFVGGVCAESTVRMQGLRLLGNGESTLLRITPTDAEPSPPEDSEGYVVVGNPCLSGGTLDIFLEAVLPATLVHVFGDGPIARALVRVAEAAGYAVMASTNPVESLAPDTAAVVVASHGRDEEKVLAAALRAGVPYVGLIASPKRGKAVMSEVDATEELRARVHTPAGLDIGARTPLEIAVSVVAEVVSVRARVEAPPTPQPVVELTAIDPVCGMTVAAVEASLHHEHDGTTWYFCGSGCQRAFADDPGRYGA